jgi:hypothetical protein
VIVWSPVSVKRVTVTVDAAPVGIWVAPMTTGTELPVLISTYRKNKNPFQLDA